MSWQILRADARSLPLADRSVDLIVCSPPYWGLRSYRDGGEHYDGQVGSEATPQSFVDELVGMIDAEWRRVLKPCGSMFLNLGDKYASGGRSTYDHDDKHAGREGSHRGQDAARPKSLLGLPWRIALALIDRGWILRSEIVWSKPNGLPESVQDRVRRSHEQVFHFVLEPRYYAAVDRIREAQLTKEREGTFNGESRTGERTDGVSRERGWQAGVLTYNALGRLPGSVWTIPTSPLIVPDAHRKHWDLPDHFAAFPPELVRRIVLGWSPERVCVVCGEGRRPVVERTYRELHRQARNRAPRQELGDDGFRKDGGFAGRVESSVGSNDVAIVGEGCGCPIPDAPTTPGVVLDPMAGTGTTVGVAHKLGRHGIGVDLSHDYCRLAKWRVESSGHFDMIEDRTAAERQGRML